MKKRTSFVRVSGNNFVVTHHQTWSRAREVMKNYLRRARETGQRIEATRSENEWQVGEELVYIVTTKGK